MRNRPSCQLHTSEGGRRGREGGDGEEGVWIARFTPTDLHLPRRRRPPPADARTPLPAGPSQALPRSSRQHRGPAAHPALGSREREAAGRGERLCKRIPCSASRPPPPKYCTAGEAATRRRRPDEQRTPSSSAHAEPSSSVRCALPSKSRARVAFRAVVSSDAAGSRKPVLFFRGGSWAGV